MSITVTPNADGSYTVRCNGVAVTVGGASSGRGAGKQDDDDFDAGQQKGPILLPPRPKPNDPGPVVANLKVLRRQPGGLGVAGSAAERNRLVFDGVVPLASRLDEFLSARRGPLPSGQRVLVRLALTPQDELDLESLFAALAEVALSRDVRIELDIAVQAGRAEAAPL